MFIALKNISSFLLHIFCILTLCFVAACNSEKEKQAIIMDMPYHEARKIIIQSGWEPVLGNTSDENIGIPAIIFRDQGYIEVRDCTSTGIGYCAFYFKNKKGEYLRISTEGEDNGPGARQQARVIYAAIRENID